LDLELKEPKTPDRLQPELKFSLFDSDGLPWCSRLDWGWLFILSAITSFFGAILLGIYVGLWLKSKGRSSVALYAYLVLSALFVMAFLPLPTAVPFVAFGEKFGSLMGLAIWVGAGYIVRSEVIRYYSEREGVRFHISPLLTGFLSVWYISGLLRADFPLDQSGKAAQGTLKLTT